MACLYNEISHSNDNEWSTTKDNIKESHKHNVEQETRTNILFISHKVWKHTELIYYQEYGYSLGVSS